MSNKILSIIALFGALFFLIITDVDAQIKDRENRTGLQYWSALTKSMPTFEQMTSRKYRIKEAKAYNNTVTKNNKEKDRNHERENKTKTKIRELYATEKKE